MIFIIDEQKKSVKRNGVKAFFEKKEKERIRRYALAK